MAILHQAPPNARSMSQNTGGNQVDPAISPPLIRFKWMISDSKSPLGMRKYQLMRSFLDCFEQLHVTDFLRMFLQPLLLALRDPAQSNPPDAARSCLPGPDQSPWFATKRDSWGRFHKRLRPRGHAPSLVEMDYQFPGKENSKRTNKSDLTGASILHSAKGLEDHSCIRYTLKVLVGPCWKPLRVEIVRLARF